MLARNGSNGTPTMPGAQVKIFRGIGVKPAITSIQNAIRERGAPTTRALRGD